MADTDAVPTAPPLPAVRIPPSFLYASGNRLTSEQVDAFLASSTRPSFFYGTLMFPKLLAAITQNDDLESIIANMTGAALPGYRRYALDWADFPVVLPSDRPDDYVDGVLLFGLSETEKNRLHAYESGLYTVELARVEFQLFHGVNTAVAAEVYVWKGARHEVVEVEEREWSVEEFLRGRSGDIHFQ